MTLRCTNYMCTMERYGRRPGKIYIKINMKKLFNNQQLQLISHCAGILRACTDIPFNLANKINSCKMAADAALKVVEDKILLIEERKTGHHFIQSQKDMDDVLKEKSEIEIIELKESEFSSLNISGDKEVVQFDGAIKRFSYRDAYFNLLGIIILQ